MFLLFLFGHFSQFVLKCVQCVIFETKHLPTHSVDENEYYTEKKIFITLNGSNFALQFMIGLKHSPIADVQVKV